MKATRLYTGKDGQSHFEDIDINLDAFGSGELRSEVMKTGTILFRQTEGWLDQGWHNAPARQFVITLRGKGEIEIGDGTRRVFGPGDILLAEDLTGRGHVTRGVGSEPRVSIFVTLT
jgi:quercetin dioxygenase-like cupin family protein